LILLKYLYYSFNFLNIFIFVLDNRQIVMDLAKCLDQTNALNAVVSVLMVVAGGVLMGGAAPNLGVALMALGLLILALAINDRDLSALKDPLRALKSTRSMLAVGSAAALLVGRLLMHFHVQKLLEEHNGDYRVVAELAKEMPAIINVLMYGGMAGIIASLAMNKDGSLNLTRGGLAVAAAAAIHWTSRKVHEAMAAGDEEAANRALMTHYASYGLLVLAVAYAC
jgi:hypothetical protein